MHTNINRNYLWTKICCLHFHSRNGTELENPKTPKRLEYLQRRHPHWSHPSFSVYFPTSFVKCRSVFKIHIHVGSAFHSDCGTPPNVFPVSPSGLRAPLNYYGAVLRLWPDPFYLINRVMYDIRQFLSASPSRNSWGTNYFV